MQIEYIVKIEHEYEILFEIPKYVWQIIKIKV